MVQRDIDHWSIMEGEYTMTANSKSRRIGITQNSATATLKALFFFVGFLVVFLALSSGARASEPTRYCGMLELIEIQAVTDPLRPEITLDVDYRMQLNNGTKKWKVEVLDSRAVTRAYAAVANEPGYFHDGSVEADVRMVPVTEKIEVCLSGNYFPNSSEGGVVTRSYQLDIWKDGVKILDNARFDP